MKGINANEICSITWYGSLNCGDCVEFCSQRVILDKIEFIVSLGGNVLEYYTEWFFNIAKNCNDGSVFKKM